MQEKYQNQVHPVGICGRLYGFFIAIITARRLSSGVSESGSSNTEDSESEVEFWEAEDLTTSDESDDTSGGLIRKEALQKGKEKIREIEAKNKRDQLELVQDLGMYDGTSLSLVQEKTSCRSSGRYVHGQEASSAEDGVRAKEATKLETKGSPEMVMLNRCPDMVMRQRMRAKLPIEGSDEVGAKTRNARTLSRVFTNINEKSDAFIRSRKGAMRRSYSASSKMF